MQDRLRSAISNIVVGWFALSTFQAFAHGESAGPGVTLPAPASLLNDFRCQHGYSLYLHGLERGFNDNAYDRAIVMHGASYVSDAFAQQWHRIGRSWGCPALAEGVAPQVIDSLKNTSLLFAYYPDRKWLKESKFLNGCVR